MHCVFLADLFFAESWGEPPDGMGSGIMPICSLLLPRRNGMHLTMEAYLPGIPVLYHSDTSALLQEDTSDNGTHLHRRQQLFLLYYRALQNSQLRLPTANGFIWRSAFPLSQGMFPSSRKRRRDPSCFRA